MRILTCLYCPHNLWISLGKNLKSLHSSSHLAVGDEIFLELLEMIGLKETKKALGKLMLQGSLTVSFSILDLTPFPPNPFSC